jgi:hypothetical protein
MPESITHTRVVRQCELDGEELAERIALFAVVTRSARAATVLDGLVAASAKAGKKLLEKMATWPSGKRQARVTLEFGLRGDQHQRLAALVAEAQPVLRLALCAQMTPHQQARFPNLLKHEFRQVPGRNTFAGRLVREATR